MCKYSYFYLVKENGIKYYFARVNDGEPFLFTEDELAHAYRRAVHTPELLIEDEKFKIQMNRWFIFAIGIILGFTIGAWLI